MQSSPRIAIVGGGPAGLTMGVLLHKHRIPFTIFELRQEPNAEELAKPSGMLDLQERSGLAAIKECGVYDEFIPLTGECSQDYKVVDRDGKVLFKVEGDRIRPEISRNNLTKLLKGKIPAENIKWGHKLLSATQSAASGYPETELDFGAQGKHSFDLVVGADGAWSKVRKLLTDTAPDYSGTQHITFTMQGVTQKYPHLAEFLGSGSFTALANKHAIVAQRGPRDSARVYTWLTVPEDFADISGLGGKTALAAKDKLLNDNKLLGNFGSAVKELVAAACDEEAIDNPEASLEIKALHELPHGGSWEHNNGATLVGDAAHLMLPNGEGVNLAMLDAVLLSKIIIKAYEEGLDTSAFMSTIDPLLEEFETALVERAKEAGKFTKVMMSNMFGTEDAAYEWAGFLNKMRESRSQKEQ